MKRVLQEHEQGEEDREEEEEEDSGSGVEDGHDGEEDDDDQEYDDDEAPPCPVQCWEDAVTVTDALVRDAHTLWNNYGGDKTVAKSFWVDSDAEPRCLLEFVALEMADFHLQGAEYAGVEIWTQFRASNAPNRGLEFHFDKDERLAAASEKIWKHPVVGTATYLTTGGAPLVVFATASPEGDEPDDEGGDDVVEGEAVDNGGEEDENDCMIFI